MQRIEFSLMQQTIQRALQKAGLDDESARICARIHTESSCDGISSHGLNRVARFVDYVRKGWVNIHAKPELEKSLGAIAIYNGNRGIGITNALFAVGKAMEMAKEQGVGIVALKNSSHWMRGGSYGWYAAERGMAAICWTNTESCMPAWGGKNTRIGNNPFVMAVPRAKGPIVLDMAMSQYSYGKLQVTRLKNEKLPFPGGYDKDGHLTDEPGPIEASMRILPTGYWKGSGLAIVLDAMAALLSAGSPTHEIDKIGEGSCTGASQIFMVFDPSQLGGAEFTNRMADGVAEYVNQSEPAENSRDVRYPGQTAALNRQENLRLGIPADEAVWDEVMQLAE
ncbi:3-dehydro-L-gulonate 2-dehydrogenase [Rahnella sp. AA]|uniref:3-dehydro-L-gulonate 2-dehydrogenase n=1 Tax=Rahnella sp. AA TaxID=2057180 RepID=UPI000C33B95F|nr:3-dehydro-L-gulonate 2-dehydrogenase [Rahnella sp. AA]PKE31898.1 3-dehydro-L-gulonate 2-dehydrogenase [Rahnella sp. AA]